MSQKSKVIPVRLSLSVILALSMNAPALSMAQAAQPAIRQQAPAQQIERPEVANRKILNWLKEKETNLTGWMATRSQPGGIPDYLDYHLVKSPMPLSPLSEQEKVTAARTKELYDQYFPRTELSSYVGTFFESGNPHVNTRRGPHQWDSHKVMGLDDLDVFEGVVKKVVSSGVKSIRIGPNLFDIKTGGLQSWQRFVEKIDVIWEAGGTPTISVAFFPSLERWKVKGADGKVDESQSFLLNPKWPSEMAEMTKDMMDLLNVKSDMYEKRTGKKARFAINPINEPETLAGFNRQFWHGAYANWSSPLLMKYYVPSVIAIAKANVAIRQAVEEKSQGKRILFMHNEAMTPTYYPSHKGPGRFAVSKFMLGDDQILKTDFNTYFSKPLSDLKSEISAAAQAGTMTEVQWALKEYVFGSWNTTAQMQQAALKDLVNRFNDLKSAHLGLAEKTGKTVKTDNMLWVDYYYQTEFILNRPVSTLVKQLAANDGALLKSVLDVKDEATVLRMMRTAVLDSKRRMPYLNIPEMGAVAALFKGVNLAKVNMNDLDKEIAKMPAVDLSQVGFQNILSAEDNFLFYSLIGIRNAYTYANDDLTKARRAKFPLFRGEVKRTDELLESLLAKKGQKLRSVLNVKNDQQLMNVLLAAANDTRAGGKAVALTGNESLREILNKDERKVLERLFGMSREQLLGFEPQHYARHIRLGIRDGFYKFAMEYVNNLRLHTIGVGESGTPFYVFAPLLHDQVMMEYASVLRSGVYGTQYAFGPAVDTRGWAKGPLSEHVLDDNEINPSGAFSIVKEGNVTKIIPRSFDPKKPGWVQNFLSDFFNGMRNK